MINNNTNISKTSIRKHIMLLLIVLLMINISGCASKKLYPEGKTVGIAMASKSIERWSRDGLFLKEKFESAGYNVELRYSNSDSYQQNNDIECLIADGVDVLIVCAVDGDALTQTLKNAQYAQIPVISYDRLIMNTDAVDYYISFDNYEVGCLLSEYTLQKFALASFDKFDYLNDVNEFDENIETQDGAYNVEIIAGDPADNNARMFFGGAYDTLRPYIESGVIKIPSGKMTFEQNATNDWSTDLAYQNMQDTLASYYGDGTRLDAIIANNDNTALGAAQAVSSDYFGNNYPLITGQDGNIANLRNIINGKQAMTVYKNVQDEAIVTVELVKALLSGKTLDESIIDSLPIECVFDNKSYDNGKKIVDSFLLLPTVITKNNIQTLVDSGNYRWDENHEYLLSLTGD